MRKIVATIEARMTSSRLPGKVLLDLAGEPALKQMINRIRKSKLVDEIVVATTVNKTDDPIVDLCSELGSKVFRGDENDVLKRVLDAAKFFEATHIVELTGDCPLIDPCHIDKMIEFYFSQDFNYVFNRLKKGLPDGFDVQVFSVKDLEVVDKSTNDPIDRVHVSCYFYNNPSLFRIGWLGPKEGDEEYWPDLALTLDEKNDYVLLDQIFKGMDLNKNIASALDIMNYLRKNPHLLKINQDVRRKELNEG